MSPERTVTFACPFVPPEWIAAHGLQPRRVAPPASVPSRPIGPLTGLCPFARAYANLAAEADGSAVVLTTACDQMRRVADLVASVSDVPLFVLDVPHTWETAAAAKLYLSELKRLGRFLESVGGRRPDRAALIECARRYDAGRRELRRAARVLHGRRWSDIAFAFHATGQVAEWCAEPKPTGPALALVGGPLLGDRLELLDLVEATGGYVGFNATESGEIALPGDLDPNALEVDPLAAVADAHFQAIPAAFRRPNSLLFERLAAEIPARGIRGVVLHRFMWCDTWHAEAHRLKETLPVPVVEIDASDDGTDLQRTRTRLGAFMESLR